MNINALSFPIDRKLLGLVLATDANHESDEGIEYLQGNKTPCNFQLLNFARGPNTYWQRLMWTTREANTWERFLWAPYANDKWFPTHSSTIYMFVIQCRVVSSKRIELWYLTNGRNFNTDPMKMVLQPNHVVRIWIMFHVQHANWIRTLLWPRKQISTIFPVFSMMCNGMQYQYCKKFNNLSVITCENNNALTYNNYVKEPWKKRHRPTHWALRNGIPPQKQVLSGQNCPKDYRISHSVILCNSCGVLGAIAAGPDCKGPGSGYRKIICKTLQY